MPPGVRVADRLARPVFAAAVLVSMVVLFAPAGDVPSAPPGVDTVVHAVLFLVLAVSGRWAGAGPWNLGPALVLYAAVSEVLQGLAVIGRTSSVADWLADLVGLLVGLVLGQLVARRTR
jgi:VanZ family protein